MKYLKENYPKLAVLASLSLAITFGYHNLLPGHKAEFSGSYLLHFFMDSVITGILLFIVFGSNLQVDGILDRYFKWEKYPVKRLLLQVIVNTFVSSVLIYFSVMAYAFILSVFYPEVISGQKTSGADGVLRSAALIFISIFLLYQFAYIGYYFFRQWTRSLIVAESLKRENLSSQLQALQVQVNPHFLFNSLSSLASLIDEDKVRAAKFLEELASVYRYLLSQRKESLITISEEMQFIRSFIYLHKSRCGEGFHTEISLSPDNLRQMIPPQTIQILVENAIKHNITAEERPLLIKIYARGNMLIVENNLQLKISKQKQTGTGLQNIKDRYLLLCEKEINIESTGDIFRVSVPMLNKEILHERTDN